ncbi:MAG: transcription antitermination factor NusB [Actinobacteria bacterium]|nr:transcription antitermination factor NusB [Actinomycetota bacterium]
MPSGRRTARRQAVFALYRQDLLELTSDDVLSRDGGFDLNDYASSLVRGVGERRSQIDAILAEHLSGWSVERLGVLERAIMRVGAYELLWVPDIPAAVAIDEAVSLAKRFCSDEAGALVNGVLGSLVGSQEVGVPRTQDVGFGSGEIS